MSPFFGYIFAASSNRQDNLADVPTLIEDVVRFFCLLNGQDGVDGGSYAPILDHRIHIAHNGGKDLGLHRGSARAQGTADDADIADIDVLKVDLGQLPRKRGDHDPTRTVGKIVEAFAHDLAAEAVDGYIHGVPRLKLLTKCKGDVLLPRYNNTVGTERSDACRLRLGTDGGDHACAKGLGHRDQSTGKTGCSRVH